MSEKWKIPGKKSLVFLICCFLLLFLPGDFGLGKAAGEKESVTGNVWASEVGLNKTSAKIAPGEIFYLKLGGVSSGIKWSVNNKRIVSVNSGGKVIGLAKGSAMVQAKYKGVTYSCKVVVEYGTSVSKDGMEYEDVGGTFGYTGRWFKKSIEGGKYYYTTTGGGAIYFKVAGSKYVDVSFISRIAIATPYFAYSVDGGKMRRQSISNRRINLGNAKTHYVRLVIDAMAEGEDKWAGEAGVGVKSIKTVTKGGAVTAIRPKNRVIAFFGDSITEGIRALDMALMPSGTSAVNSYAYACAAELNMVPYYAGYGGSGIVQNGSFVSCYNAITRFSETRQAKKFDADVIVLEHGTNDVYTDSGTFMKGYRTVLKKLHSQHPQAVIFCMIPFTQYHAEDIRSVAGGYSWCEVVETSGWSISYTDGLHPDVMGARTVGKNLANRIMQRQKKIVMETSVESREEVEFNGEGLYRTGS